VAAPVRGPQLRFGAIVDSLAVAVLAFRHHQLLELDYRNRDIAMTLGTSPATIKKHLTHVFDKVGVDTRTQLVARIA